MFDQSDGQVPVEGRPAANHPLANYERNTRPITCRFIVVVVVVVVAAAAVFLVVGKYNGKTRKAIKHRESNEK